MSTMKDYFTIVVGTDGSVPGRADGGRAAWLAQPDDADLVIVCASRGLPARRCEERRDPGRRRPRRSGTRPRRRWHGSTDAIAVAQAEKRRPPQP